MTTEVDKQKTDIENKEAELEKSHQVMETWETQMVAFWEEGEAFKQAHQKLKQILGEKEEIERLRKNRNTTSKQKAYKQLVMIA